MGFTIEVAATRNWINRPSNPCPSTVSANMNKSSNFTETRKEKLGSWLFVVFGSEEEVVVDDIDGDSRPKMLW